MVTFQTIQLLVFCFIFLLLAFMCTQVFLCLLYVLVALFFVLNAITLDAAAAEFPNQYIFFGPHVVFGSLIQHQTLSRTREKKLGLWRIHCFEFNGFLCDKDP